MAFLGDSCGQASVMRKAEGERRGAGEKRGGCVSGDSPLLLTASNSSCKVKRSRHVQKPTLQSCHLYLAVQQGHSGAHGVGLETSKVGIWFPFTTSPGSTRVCPEPIYAHSIATLAFDLGEIKAGGELKPEAVLNVE